MTYITGTVTDSNSPSALYALVATALTSAGYTFVETVVIGTRTHRIWKSPAAGNPANKDWYLDVAHTTTGTGTFGMYAYEDYDVAQHKCLRACHAGISDQATPDATTWSRWGATPYDLENANVSPRAGGGNNQASNDFTLPATSFGYWMSIRTDRIAFTLSMNPDAVFYIGMYEPDPAYQAKWASVMFPLMSASLIGRQSGGTVPTPTAASRHPGAMYRAESYNYWDRHFSFATQDMLDARQAGVLVPSGGSSIMAPSALRHTLSMRNYNNLTAVVANPAAGWLAGWLYDCAVLTVDATVTRGDTVQIGGNSWTLASPNSNYASLFRAN